MIAGLQKMTLLDYPGKVACTLFLQGCNFRCPFCHNAGLLGSGEQAMSWEEFFAFLQKRRGLLDGVCITGGEPTLCPELPERVRQIKALGFAVKLDTNGSRPEVLKALVGEGLLDYVAMDVKNCPARYGETVGNPHVDLDAVAQSIAFLLEDRVDYEFRTTVVAQLHTQADMRAMGQWLLELSGGKKAKKIFLQQYTHSQNVLCGGLCPPDKAQLQAFLAELRPFVHRGQIRGVTE